MQTTQPIGWIPYVNGATFGGSTVVAANGGYARYANLSAAKNIWSSGPSAGDQGNALFPPPNCALITVYTQDVRTRSGTNPTATEGRVMPAGTTTAIDNDPEILRDFRLFEVAATAEVTIQYFYTLG